MQTEITQALAELEARHEVTVLYACESGSRAWGFASADSDYDVRFIYLHRPSWYLAIDLEAKRDVIECPLTGLLDVTGWDLRKALGLLRKSNPPLLEWLSSPIVYRDDGVAASQLRALGATIYSPLACGHHYLQMAKGNLREYLTGEVVWRKKYFYVLRPLLALRWLDLGLGVVPMAFAELVEACLPAGELRAAISQLQAEKAAGAELDRGPRIAVISQFIESELAMREGLAGLTSAPQPPVEPLNALFRAELQRVYPADGIA
jgi:uncharacterized protein